LIASTTTPTPLHPLLCFLGENRGLMDMTCGWSDRMISHGMQVDMVSVQQCPCKALPLREASKQEYVGR